MDSLLLLTQLMLGVYGVVGVAASEPALWPGHLFRVLFGLLVTVIVSRLSSKAIVKLSPIAYITVLIMLIYALLRGVAPTTGQSFRWIDMGLFTVQPSELMKVTVIAYLAAFFHNHRGNWEIWRPMLVIGLAAGAIVAAPDLSTALFILALAFAIMLAAGTTLTRLLSITLAAVLIAAPFAGHYLSRYPYIQQRLTGYVDFWGERERTQDESYQATTAERALIRAGVFGTGVSRSVYVPEAHTDMIAVAIAQALGLFGVLTLISLYLLIAKRGVSIAGKVSGPSALLAAGATIYICAQAGANLLVSSGLMVVTGTPLPFVSHGLNSLLSVSVATGFIHLAYREAIAQGESS